ncbi:MAG TPA: hypothetical protein VNU96_00415 [Burkholderiales bacterium]|nr:hypothetical protein [Burkholderiales bacterium]
MARVARDEHRRNAARGKHPAEPLRLEVPGMLTTPLPVQIESLFQRFPALCGFSVQGPDELPDTCSRSGDGSELFVADVGIAPPLGAEQSGEIVREIVSVLAEFLAEDPEADEILRGRTFARVLH